MTSVLYRDPRASYPMAVSATGMYFRDGEGKQYLDMSGGAAVSALGHAHPDVVAAIQAQAAKLEFAHTAFFTSEPQERLAARLAERFGEPGALVYFTSGGSEANETALKACWQYWAARGRPQKKIVISRENSYHGNTLGTLSVSGNSARRRASAAPLLDWPRISPCYAFRDRRSEESMERYVERVSDELDAAIMSAGAENVAAFICEPIVGSSLGAVPAEAGYLQRIREICDRHEVLWIADEIMCGSGRSGRFFAFEHDCVRPDLVSLAKGLAAGYQPLAATILSARVAETLTQSGFAHGHTYVAHVIACAAGLAVQEVFDRDGLVERARVKGDQFSALLADKFADHPNVADIRGRGLFRALELVSDRETMRGFENAPDMTSRLIRHAMEAGLVVYPGAVVFDGAVVPHIILAPPLIVEDDHFQECVEKLEVVLERVFHAERVT